MAARNPIAHLCIDLGVGIQVSIARRIFRIAAPVSSLLFDVVRWSKPFLLAGSILLLFPSLTRSTALAQESFSPTLHDSALPDAPQPVQVRSSSGPNDSQQTGVGTISGTVLDANRDVLQGARVTLAGSSGSLIRWVESGNDGQFALTGLPPDVYKLTVKASGMKIFTSAQISLHAGETHIMPPITLSVFGGLTSVTVNGNKEQLSKQQVQIAVQQRIGGVIPNFYSNYDWNAPPMLAKQKFSSAFVLSSIRCRS